MLDNIKTELSQSQILLGTVDRFQEQKSIFHCRVDQEDKEIISSHASFEDMTVRLTAGTPTKDQKIPDGLYHGSMYYIESDPLDVYPSNLEQDRFKFNLSIPEQHFHSLIDALRADPKSTLKIGVHVCTFGDDGYKEIHLIPPNGAYAFVNYAGVKSKHGLHVYDTHNNREETPYQHTSPEQITSEKILAQLQSNNRWLSAIAIMVTVALVIVLF